MQFVTVVNRTSRSLTGKWDGKDYVIPPGKSSYPVIVAEAIRRANPIMGSDDLSTGNLQYLIGIEEQGDPVTPIEQSDEIELYNRGLAKNAIPIVVIPGNTGMYAIRATEVAAPQSQDSTFVKP